MRCSFRTSFGKWWRFEEVLWMRGFIMWRCDEFVFGDWYISFDQLKPSRHEVLVSGGTGTIRNFDRNDAIWQVKHSRYKVLGLKGFPNMKVETRLGRMKEMLKWVFFCSLMLLRMPWASKVVSRCQTRCLRWPNVLCNWWSGTGVGSDYCLC